MTAADLPRTDRVSPPARGLLGRSSRWGPRLLRAWWDIGLHGTEHVPVTGPVIVAANHIGFLDGPLLAAAGPRPVHTLTKAELFAGPLGMVLSAAGQIRLDRFHPDPGAVRTSLRVLRDGGAVGIFPEGVRGDGELTRFHRGVAYLALVTGAPVVPLAFFGTREPGRGSGTLPRRGARLDLVYGAPYSVAAAPWPRTQEQVAGVSLLLRERLRGHLADAKALTGRSLPGPLPVGDRDPDPLTGVTDPGAP